MKKYRVINQNDNQPQTGRVLDTKSLTRPAMSYGIKEIYQRFVTTGTAALNVYSDVYYDGQSKDPKLSSTNLKSLDLTEIDELKVNLQERINENTNKLKELEKKYKDEEIERKHREKFYNKITKNLD